MLATSKLDMFRKLAGLPAGTVGAVFNGVEDILAALRNRRISPKIDTKITPPELHAPGSGGGKLSPSPTVAAVTPAPSNVSTSRLNYSTPGAPSVDASVTKAMQSIGIKPNAPGTSGVASKPVVAPTSPLSATRGDIAAPPLPAAVPVAKPAPVTTATPPATAGPTGQVVGVGGVPVGKPKAPRFGSPNQLPTPGAGAQAGQSIADKTMAAADSIYSAPQNFFNWMAGKVRPPLQTHAPMPGAPGVKQLGQAVDAARNATGRVLEGMGAKKHIAAGTAATAGLGGVVAADALTSDQQPAQPTTAAQAAAPGTPGAAAAQPSADATKPAATPATALQPPVLDERFSKDTLHDNVTAMKANAEAEFRKDKGLAPDAQLTPAQSKQVNDQFVKQRDQFYTEMGYANKQHEYANIAYEADKILADPNASGFAKAGAMASKIGAEAKSKIAKLTQLSGLNDASVVQQVQSEIAEGVKSSADAFRSGVADAVKTDQMPGIMDFIKQNPQALLVPAGLLMMMFGGKTGLILGGLAAAWGGKGLYDRYQEVTDPAFQQAFAKHFADPKNATPEAMKQLNDWLRSPATDKSGAEAEAEAKLKRQWTSAGLLMQYGFGFGQSRAQQGFQDTLADMTSPERDPPR